MREAEFFLNSLAGAGRLTFEARCHFSAFLSASRSITLALQATMSDIPGFDEWYRQAQARLKIDPLARFFVEIRNDAVHRGLNPLDRVTLEHLRENLFMQLNHRSPTHTVVLPYPRGSEGTALADALQVSTEYFVSLVVVVYDCYEKFRHIVDPRWYFTIENFRASGKTIEDATLELGFPSNWFTRTISEDAAWRVIRSQQPACLVNDIFERYLNRIILDPDNSLTDGST